MTASETQRDICQLLGGLLLDGANLAVLEAVGERGDAKRLGTASGGKLGEHLGAMHQALEEDSPADLAIEYTRLLLASGEPGARGKPAVHPWEDCHGDGERRVLGARSSSAFSAYLAAGLGFEGMKDFPSDHIGLELCFVAALLDEEARGERDGAARREFMNSHLGSLASTVGAALAAASRRPFWTELGRALSALPRVLQPAESGEPPSESERGNRERSQAGQAGAGFG